MIDSNPSELLSQFSGSEVSSISHQKKLWETKCDEDYSQLWNVEVFTGGHYNFNTPGKGNELRM